MSVSSPSLSLAELNRLLCNLLRVGEIAQVDLSRALVRVRCGELLSDWLRWFEQRAGSAVTWSAPSVGEQVILLAPGGAIMTGPFTQTGGSLSSSGIVLDSHTHSGVEAGGSSTGGPQ